MNFKISVIIPCYNVEKYVDKCINSLINQTIGLQNLQLIFVNDASTDSTLKILKNYENKYPDNILIIDCLENGRQGRARNIGLQYAESEYISFIDADDYIDLNMYEILYNNIIKFKCDCVSIGTIIENVNGDVIEKNRPSILDNLVDLSTIENKKAYFLEKLNTDITSNLYKKSIITENNVLFPEKLAYEDNYWASIIYLYINSCYCSSKCSYHYVLHENSTITTKDSSHHLDRLTIELLKINKYKELGLFSTFHDEIEIQFLKVFYLNTIHILSTRFSHIPIDTLKFMQSKVLELFPNFENNSYFINNQVLFHPIYKTIRCQWNLNEWQEFFKLCKDSL